MPCHIHPQWVYFGMNKDELTKDLCVHWPSSADWNTNWFGVADYVTFQKTLTMYILSERNVVDFVKSIQEVHGAVIVTRIEVWSNFINEIMQCLKNYLELVQETIRFLPSPFEMQ